MRRLYLPAIVLSVSLAGTAVPSEEPRLHPPAVVPVAGLKLSTPQLVSLPLGVVFRRSWEPRPHVYASGGPLIQVEPGLAGHKLNLGWAFVSPDPGRPLWSLSFRLSGLRAMRDGSGIERGASYAGAEAAAHLQDVGLSLGLYVRAAGEGRDRPVVFSAGIGLGFP